MPRSTFTAGMLGNAAPGLSKLAAALAGGGQAEQMGFDAQNMQQSKMAQMLAQMEASKASAALHSAQAGEVLSKQRVLEGRPGLYEEQVAATSGVDIPRVQAIRNGLKTGTAPQLEMAGPTEDGGPLMGNIPADQQSNVMRAMQQFLPLLSNSGDLKPDDLAQAANTFRNMNLSDRVIAGQADRNSVGGAQAAVAGKPLFNSDANGAVLDQYGGQYDTSNPMAGATISLKGAQAGQAKATAANQYAGADAHRASAAKTRAEMEQGAKGTYDPTRGIIVDARAGTARPVLGQDGLPLGAKDKDLTDSQAKANLFGSRMLESDRIINSLEGKYSPVAINTKMAADGLPIVGGVAGYAGNAMLSSESQQAEQAQRDFINAVLRRESGAVISPTEFANGQRQYFPQPGDSKAVLAQKAKNRKLATEGVLAEVPAAKRGLPGLTDPTGKGQPADAPQAGAVIEGYRFKGGDPANQANWERV